MSASVNVAGVSRPETELVAALRDFAKGMLCSHEQSLVFAAAADVIEAYGKRLFDCLSREANAERVKEETRARADQLIAAGWGAANDACAYAVALRGLLDRARSFACSHKDEINAPFCDALCADIDAALAKNPDKTTNLGRVLNEQLAKHDDALTGRQRGGYVCSCGALNEGFPSKCCKCGAALPACVLTEGMKEKP